MPQDTSPSEEQRNPLQHANSSYLRSAQHQPVQWHAWGQEAFARAQAEDKPILLDIGAVWCHWCHVMDRESYEDAELAGIINDHYIAVKVDRDERPDVDARYQAAVSAISGARRLAAYRVFLLPTDGPSSAAPIFPAKTAMAAPVSAASCSPWPRSGRSAVTRPSNPPAASWQPSSRTRAVSGRGNGELTLALVDKIAGSALANSTPATEVFGAQPKFPHPAALDLLLHFALNRDNDEARKAFLVTLEKMAHGGVYDQLAGGFHRYSVDERWIVPHFEKMLYDNTELLRNYVHGFQSFAREDFRKTALEILAWLDSTMTDRQRGGFYASQGRRHRPRRRRAITLPGRLPKPAPN